MRVIRFRTVDGRTHLGLDHGDGSATVVVGSTGTALEDASNAPLLLLRDRSVLVADDDENIRQLLTTVLEHLGCNCIVCRDGAEAMAALEEHTPDLIVSDIRMPHHSGYEIYAAARRLHDNIPILLITGFGYDPSHSLLQVQESDGQSLILYKPFTPDQLQAEIGHAVRDTITGSERFRLTAQREQVRETLAPVELDTFLDPLSNSGAGGEPMAILERPLLRSSDSRGTIRLERTASEGTIVQCSAEVAVVLGSPGAIPKTAESLDQVLGFSSALRFMGTESRTGRSWEACCLSPVLVTPDDDAIRDDLTCTVTIGDRSRQSMHLREIRTRAARLVSEINALRRPERGDVIMCGRLLAEDGPDAASIPVTVGDKVCLDVTGIGSTTYHIEA